MKARISTLPVCIIGPTVTRPEPETKFKTPGGRCLAYTSIVSTWAKPPIVGSLRTATLPGYPQNNIININNNKAYSYTFI